MTKHDCPINLFYSAEHGGYIADTPDLKSCSTFGGSLEEALKEVLVAKTARLEGAKGNGKVVPRPRFRPAIDALAH